MRYGKSPELYTIWMTCILSLRDLFLSRNELSITLGLLLYHDRIVILESLRSELLEIIHEGDQGINKCRARAQTSVWWPRISSDIKTELNLVIFVHKVLDLYRLPLKMKVFGNYSSWMSH